jgi:hypothetical protein
VKEKKDGGGLERIIDYSFQKIEFWEKSSVSKRGFQLETHLGAWIRQ